MENVLLESVYVLVITPPGGVIIDLFPVARFSFGKMLQSISEWLSKMANRKWRDVMANGMTSHTALASRYTVIRFDSRAV